MEADTCMLYPLVFNCRGGGWYVMCAKFVAVTWLYAHCFDKNFVLPFVEERGIYHYLLQLTKCKHFVCLF